MNCNHKLVFPEHKVICGKDEFSDPIYKIVPEESKSALIFIDQHRLQCYLCKEFIITRPTDVIERPRLVGLG